MPSTIKSKLYIDEVDLLDDHLIDVMLDVAASNVNIVEATSAKYIRLENLTSTDLYEELSKLST